MRIQLLSPGQLWDIVDFCPWRADEEESWETEDAERYRQGQHRRIGYLARKMDEGARIQVAYRDDPDGDVIGFIEYYPIEVTNLELVGDDILAIWCMLVREERQGIGSALLQACLDDARALGRKGVALTRRDPFWMPRAILERAGFVEVGPAGRNGAVLFYPLVADAPPPRWVGRRPDMELVEGQVVVDVYHTDRCPIHWRNTTLVQEVIQELGGGVLLREHWTDEREDMLHYGIAYGVYVNREPLAAGPPLARERVWRVLRRALFDNEPHRR
jgi:GNAT superfamily N-acetyltransferase